jgi:phosphate butyryltransferase
MPDLHPGVPTGGFLENRTFNEIVVGDTASLSHTVMQRDIDLFAAATGDFNPAHVDPVYAATDLFHTSSSMACRERG